MEKGKGLSETISLRGCQVTVVVLNVKLKSTVFNYFYGIFTGKWTLCRFYSCQYSALPV